MRSQTAANRSTAKKQTTVLVALSSVPVRQTILYDGLAVRAGPQHVVQNLAHVQHVRAAMTVG